MSEFSPDYEARILDMTPLDDYGVIFTIDETTTSKDFLATLHYLQPDQARVESYLAKLLVLGVEKLRLFDNIQIIIDDPVGEVTPNATLCRYISFSDQTTIKDVVSAYERAYGESLVKEKLIQTTLGLIDSGRLNGTPIRASMNNEFVTASDDDFSKELFELTQDYYDERGL